MARPNRYPERSKTTAGWKIDLGRGTTQHGLPRNPRSGTCSRHIGAYYGRAIGADPSAVVFQTRLNEIFSNRNSILHRISSHQWATCPSHRSPGRDAVDDWYGKRMISSALASMLHARQSAQ